MLSSYLLFLNYFVLLLQSSLKRVLEEAPAAGPAAPQATKEAVMFSGWKPSLTCWSRRMRRSASASELVESQLEGEGSMTNPGTGPSP